MMTATLLCALGAFVVSAHLVSICTAWLRCGTRFKVAPVPDDLPPITVVRPLCGIETFSAETLAASFAIDYPGHELLFCVRSPDDAIIPLVEAAMAAHPGVPARLLVGDDPISINPKLNNMVKGWREATKPYVVFIDSNVLIGPRFVAQAMATWRQGTGLVTAPPVGTRPANFGGHLECAFLNTHEARWQYFVDTFGFGFAQGKTLLYRKSDLDRTQMRELAEEPAEDAASTKMVRRLGLNVNLAPPSPQPLGRREIKAVWDRQVRWARLRRQTFLAAFLPEVISGSIPAFLIVGLAAYVTGHPVALWVGGTVVLWYAAELALAAACRWPLTWQTLPASILRDLMLPALYVSAFSGSTFTWQGNAMEMGKRGRDGEVDGPIARPGA